MNKLSPIILNDLDEIIKEELPWEELKDSTVLITGASGMVASMFLYTLLELNDRFGYHIKVLGLVRNLEKAKKIFSTVIEREDLELIVQDVSEPLKVDGKVDYIVHAASQATPKYFQADPVGTIKANTMGTFNTLELAREKKVKKYMFISSREIYGDPAPGQETFKENEYGYIDPTQVRSCYSEGKRAAETICVTYKSQYQVDTKIARLSHAYGPGMALNDGRVQADFANDVINNRNIVLKSDGSTVRTYTYVKDAVSALFYIMLVGEEIAYNIANEDAFITIRDLAKTIVSIYPEKKLELVFDIPDPSVVSWASPSKSGVLDCERLRGVGWNADVSIFEGFRRTIENYKYELDLKE